MKFMRYEDLLSQSQSQEFIIVDYISCNMISLTINEKRKLFMVNETIENFLKEKHTIYEKHEDYMNKLYIPSMYYKCGLCVFDGIDYYIVILSSTNSHNFGNLFMNAFNEKHELTFIDENNDFGNYKFIDFKFVNGKLKDHKDVCYKENSILKEYCDKAIYDEHETLQLLSQWTNPFEHNNKTIDMFN